jgi:uncharacterized protein
MPEPGESQASAAPPEQVGRVRRWLRRPLLLLPIKALLVIVPVAVANILAVRLHWSQGTRTFLFDPLAIALAVALFALYTRRVEGRAVTELSARGAPRQLLLGMGLGSVAFAVVIGVLAALDLYRVTGIGRWSMLALPFVSSLLAGVFEELFFRGVLFRIAEDSLGSYWALAISSMFFGAAHLLNPHATWLAAIAIMVEAGIFLSAAYMLTRRLWLPIGIHAGWNFTQGGVFGVAVSGVSMHGLLQGTLSGPTWLSGGEFGAESSLVAIVFCGGLGVAMLLWARRLHHVVAPYWRRSPRARAYERA